VLTLSANDVYVVRSQKKEYLIPAIKSVVKKIDLEKEIMLIDPIDGLLDL
jgi:16S rRNA processing protein RimM